MALGDQMKRIAFLSYDWDYEIMSTYYEGMRDYLKDISGVSS
jgi:hypothetical protein